jgi:hypothetical protein
LSVNSVKTVSPNPIQERALKKLVAANNGNKFKDGVLLWTSELTRPDKIYK